MLLLIVVLTSPLWFPVASFIVCGFVVAFAHVVVEDVVESHSQSARALHTEESCGKVRTGK